MSVNQTKHWTARKQNHLKFNNWSEQQNSYGVNNDHKDQLLQSL